MKIDFNKLKKEDMKFLRLLFKAGRSEYQRMIQKHIYPNVETFLRKQGFHVKKHR